MSATTKPISPDWWCILRGDSQFNADTVDRLREYAHEGKLLASDLIWNPAEREWRPADQTSPIAEYFIVAAAAPRVAWPVIAHLLLAAALAAIGLATLSQATTGVGLICSACLFAIYARISQAKHQHAQMMDLLRAKRP